jgi:hypothetical protein
LTNCEAGFSVHNIVQRSKLSLSDTENIDAVGRYGGDLIKAYTDLSDVEDIDVFEGDVGRKFDVDTPAD